MKYKPFVEVKTFNEFKTLKLSVDNTDSIYVTYDNNVQEFGTPDILYGQVVFIKDSGIIYLKGHFFTDKEFILSSEYEMSQLERENLLLQSGDTFEEAFGKIEKTIIDNELTLAYTITDLNEKISYAGKDLVLSDKYEISSLYSNDLLLQAGDTFEEAFGKIEKTIVDNELTTSRALNDLNKKFTLSSEYEISQLERENLLLQSGDTFEEAFGKIEKTIIDNELTLSYTINDLNDKISYAGKDLVLSDEYEISQLERENLLLKSGDTIEEAFGKIEKTIIDNELALAYTINDLNSKISNNYTETKSDWNETDASSSAYIQNKPDLSHFITQHQSIKTINNQTITGEGNVNISGLPSVTSSDNGKILIVVNGEWQLIIPTTVYSGTELPNNLNGNNGDLYVQTNE